NIEVDLSNINALTPDQKRNLLFNINQLLELLMQEFDDKWWPLVSNVWTRFNLKKRVN
ncbi:4411_t:CDS:1, partial [Racocetra persica]